MTVKGFREGERLPDPPVLDEQERRALYAQFPSLRAWDLVSELSQRVRELEQRLADQDVPPE